MSVDFGLLNQRVLDLAQAQSEDIARRLREAGVEIVEGMAVWSVLQVAVADKRLMADVILLATKGVRGNCPARCRTASASSRGSSSHLDALPERLIVVGSGVTGAEFAGAYGSGQRSGPGVLTGAGASHTGSRRGGGPGSGAPAAGMELAPQTRAQAVERTDEGVIVTLQDGSQLFGSHCLMAVSGPEHQ